MENYPKATPEERIRNAELIGFVIAVAAFFAGLLIGWGITAAEYKRSATKAEAAHYHATSGKFTWGKAPGANE